MSVAIYYSYPLFLIQECVYSVGSYDPNDSLDLWIVHILLDLEIQLDPSHVTRVAVLVWLTSISGPRPFHSGAISIGAN